jgi:hypothetical protein
VGLSRGLNILLDKPITNLENVSDINQAQGILKDYEELMITTK